MEDHFERLGLPRRPWLSPETVKDRFLQLSADSHPDHHGGLALEERQAKELEFTRINRAHQILSNTRERLLHLLALETNATPADTRTVPPGVASLFAPVGEALRRAEAALREKTAVLSPILKAAAYGRNLEIVDALMLLQADLRARVGTLEAEIQSLDPAWDSPTAPKPLPRLVEIATELGYLERWLNQLRTKINELSF